MRPGIKNKQRPETGTLFFGGGYRGGICIRYIVGANCVRPAEGAFRICRYCRRIRDMVLRAITRIAPTSIRGNMCRGGVVPIPAWKCCECAVGTGEYRREALPLPLGEVPRRGGEGKKALSVSLRCQLPQWGSQGVRSNPGDAEFAHWILRIRETVLHGRIRSGGTGGYGSGGGFSGPFLPGAGGSLRCTISAAGQSGRS